MKYIVAVWGLWADKLLLVAVVLLLMLTGCAKREEDYRPNSQDTKITNVVCYSYGNKIYEGQAKGRIQYWRTPPSTEFVDVNGNRMLVMGDCVVGG